MNIVSFLGSVLLFQTIYQDAYCGNVASNSKADIGYRLPKTIVPFYYNLTIDPNLETFQFNGEEEIEIVCIENTANITIHINEIRIINYAVFDFDRVEVPTTGASIDKERQFFLIVINGMLLKGSTYILKLKFHGEINDKNIGFYRSNYFDYTTNETRYLASTLMHPTEARRVFPCFDEPQLKAAFYINLYRPSNYNAASNMRLQSSTVDPENPNRVLDAFEPTLPISTYIIAFIISDFSTAQHDKYRVIARPEQISNGNGEYALTIGQSCIESMNTFTNVPYALEKLDHVAIPNRYFSFNAMENWGMIVYKEKVLLYNVSVTNADEKQRIALTISHEIAHQWFADLVTPEWFKYNWLNEGFATYFEHHTLSKIETSWRLLEQYTPEAVQAAMLADSLDSTRPMTFDAETPAEINALYDKIAYEKAGSVIRMVEHFLTPPIFQNGLSIYLQASKYGVVNSEKLWDNLQIAVNDAGILLPNGLTVRQIMYTWEYQAGYPVVNVKRSYTTGELQLTQERFRLYNDTHVVDPTWVIPINYASELNSDFDDTTPTDWMMEKDFVISTNVTESEWLILNKQQIGFYRVNYDPTNWNLIIDALKSDMSTIPPVSRAQLIDDAFNLARSGRLNYNTTLSLSGYLIQEDDYIPLYVGVNAFNHLNLMLSSSSEYTSFKNFVIQNLENTFIKYGLLGGPDEDHLTKLTRINIFPLLCSLGYIQCVQNASQIFEDWRSETLEFHQDIEHIVYCYGIKEGGIVNWDFLVEKYINSREDNQRQRMLNGLGCSSDPELLNRYLVNITSTNTFVDNFEKLQAIQSIYNGGKLGVDVTIAYLQNSFANVAETFTSAQVETILKNVGTKINSEQQLIDFKQLVTDNVDSTLIDAANAAVKDAERNLMWIDTYAQTVMDSIKTF